MSFTGTTDAEFPSVLIQYFYFTMRSNFKEGDSLTIIKPKSLNHGDMVGMIAPASPVSEEKIEKAMEFLCSLGYRVKLGKSARKEYGYLAGNDQERVEDLEQMFLDPEVKVIFCLRGGYGSTRLLDRIDYEMIHGHPKIFVGYSDITALHIAIHQFAGLVTFHGPMAAELTDRNKDRSWPVLQAVCSGVDQPCYRGNKRFVPIVPGTAEGVLTGGNLSLLCSTLGTPFEIDTRDRVLFIEEVDEEVYKIDRMLTQLRLAGKLDQAKGIILTDFRLPDTSKNKPVISLLEMIRNLLAPLKIPCFYGLSAGHCRPNFTLPIGARVRMDARRGLLHVLETVVS